MTAEQQGVSPATAGGASAPGPWDIGHSPATGGRNLYVRDSDGDVYVGVIFEPADARRIVEAMNAAERPRLAAPRDAEIEQLRTALTRYQKRLGDDLLCGGKLVERVRAALRVDNGSTCIRASMDGVAGDVGRLCDETERLRLEVASARSIADEKRAVAEELRNEADGRKDERDEARKKLYEIRALALRELDFDDEAAASEPTSELVLEIARRWHGMQAEIERLRAELDGQRADKEQAEAANDRLRARLDQHLADENSAQAANDRLREEIQNLNAAHDGTMRYITNRLADILDVDTADIHELLNTVALRIETSVELNRRELAAEPKFTDGQRVRIGRCLGTVEKSRDVTRVRLDGMAPAAQFETRFVHAIDDGEVPF